MEVSELDPNDTSCESKFEVKGQLDTPYDENDDEDKFSTLDEPVWQTLKRDIMAVAKKFLHVAYPKQNRTLLRDWDLWGPLILCTFLSVMLHGSEDDSHHDGGPDFAKVFIIYWVGAVIVTINSKLLGGTLSFFQSVCVLGYCASPLVIVLILCKLILLFGSNIGIFVIRFTLTMFGFGWATFASTAFLADSHPPNKKLLAVYPIFLFYFIISWMVISHNF